MKPIIFLVISLSLSSFAKANNQVLESKPINVDGYLETKEVEVSDGELESLKFEIEKQKKEIVLNKSKAKTYQELSKSVEKLSETTEEYLEEKRAAKEEIANYNAMVKCKSSEAPGAECEKFLRD